MEELEHSVKASDLKIRLSDDEDSTAALESEEINTPQTNVAESENSSGTAESADKAPESGKAPEVNAAVSMGAESEKTEPTKSAESSQSESVPVKQVD